MKKLSWVCALAVFIVICFTVNGFADFYVVPVKTTVYETIYEDVYIYTSVAATGQTTSYRTGDDGDLETGGVWPSPRFTDNSDGTITDNLTELIWMKDANEMDTAEWADAIDDCNSLHTGQHGLSDGSVAGDWRLPNVNELQSLIDYSNYNKALPTGHPFTGVGTTYWTSTTYKDYTDNAWQVSLTNGELTDISKGSTKYVLPVRDVAVPE